jgi:diaminopimelate epimerase
VTAGEGPLPEGAPRATERFYRAHGLGNDYLVFETTDPEGGGRWNVSSRAIRQVCDRHEGVGSDGLIVLVDRAPSDGVFPLRMFNPDGSEFERSGNGLRILASYLFREGLVRHEPFGVRCSGDTVRLTVHAAGAGGGYDASVHLGEASVGLESVGGTADALDAEGRAVHPSLGPIAFVPVSVGNPHAVVFPPADPWAGVAEVGPFLSGHPAFAEGTNVQLARVLGPARIRVSIWERGVGRTAASGTSSCAAAVAAISTGRLAPGEVVVEMEGGELRVSVTPELDVTLRGPVKEVAVGRLTRGFVDALGASDRA